MTGVQTCAFRSGLIWFNFIYFMQSFHIFVHIFYKKRTLFVLSIKWIRHRILKRVALQSANFNNIYLIITSWQSQNILGNRQFEELPYERWWFTGRVPKYRLKCGCGLAIFSFMFPTFASDCGKRDRVCYCFQCSTKSRT